MSDGKYLINKSSLTGIADAVRDKLGVGEATTDPQTGDIVYPDGKGYYTDTENIDYIAISDYESNWSNGTRKKELVSFPSSATYANYVEKPVFQVEIEGYFYWYSMTCKIIVNSQQFSLENNSTTLQKITCTFDTPKSYIRIWFQGTNKYNREQFASATGMRVLLKDENGDPIKLISSSFPVTNDGITCSIDTDTQEVQKPIPYSISDITNNIEDYWNIPEGSLNISANGTYDVTEKASAVVNVPNPSTGSLNISTNGTYDVTDKASAIVSVSPNLQTKTTTISQNGSQTITPDSNYDGLSAVNLTISVPNPSMGSLEITENGTYDVTDKASAVVNVSSGGGGGTLETWKWSDTQSTYLTFPSDFSVENLKDLTCLSGGYPRGLYKDSLGKPVSMKDQRILLPTSFTIENPLTVEKIYAAHNEGRTFCIPWKWKSGKTKEVPYDVSFVWFVVEPNDSKIYLGAGYYVNYTGNGKWTVIYT